MLTALGSCSVTAASIFSYQGAIRLARRRKLAKDVDRATHRDRDVAEKRSSQGDNDDAESVDGGTPRYLDHLAHLTPATRQNGKDAGYQATLQRGSSPLRRQDSNRSLGNRNTSGPRLGANAPPKHHDESLIREQLARNYAFVGEESMQKLRDAFVVVVGLGGVGSHVALSLIRSGVGHIRLIDFDQVSLSSLNRHAVADLNDVGRPKVVVCQEHFRSIAPWVHIQAWVEIFNESEAGRLFSPFRVPGGNPAAGKEIPPTYVIDCIDNLNTKVGLLAYCHEKSIKVFASMGAGAKCDPTRICIGDLTATEEDPLAKSVRRRLRERGIPMIPPSGKGEPSKEPKKTGKVNRESLTVGEAQTPPRKGASKGDSTSTEVTPRPADKLRKGENRRDAPPPRLPIDIPAAQAQPRNGGESRYRMSRASSASSFGSGEGGFFTPEGTPKEEESEWSRRKSESEETGKSELPRGIRTSKESKSGASSPLSVEGASASRPRLSGHRGSSGLEMLSSSPVRERPGEGVDAGYTIGSEPGFDPTMDDDDGNNEGQSSTSKGDKPVWQRSSRRRQSPERSGSSPHRQRKRGASNDGTSHKASTNGGKNPSAAGEDEQEEEPWTSQNPRYLIPCIFSTEKPAAQLLPLDEAELAKDGGVDMLRALEDGNEWRVRTLPVLGPLPAIFGLSIAAFVLCDIASKEKLMMTMEPLQTKIKRRMAEKMMKDLEASERAYPSSARAGAKDDVERFHAKGRLVPFLLDDVLYLNHEVFHSRSVVPPFDSVSNGVLVRWDSTLPLSYQNVALLTREQAKTHTAEVLKKGKSPVGFWGAEATQMWRQRMEEERWYSRLR